MQESRPGVLAAGSSQRGRRSLETTLSGADPQLVAMHDEVIERYLGSHDRADTVARAKVQILDQFPSGGGSEQSVASALHMTTRTLHRRLRERVYSFRSLLVEVRKDLVRRYMEDRSLSLTDIAFMLGYNDASAFSRAFRGWFGKSPSAMRGRG